MVFFELFSNNPDFVSVEAGHPLFTEGEEGHLMFVLTTGEAEVIVNNRVVDTLQHGNIVGEMGMISRPALGQRHRHDGLSVRRHRRKALPLSGTASPLFCHSGHARSGGAFT